LPDFIKRDLRWCQGNLQYVSLLARPGFRPMGRFQLANAIMMYLGAPAWMLMMLAGLGTAFLPATAGSAPFPVATAFALYVGMLAIGFAPRFLGVLDLLARPHERRRYGGAVRLGAGLALDTLFSLLLGPVMMVAQTLFIAGLLIGRRIGWDAQRRDGHSLPAGDALRGLWPQTLFGVFFALALAASAPGALPWAAPTILACGLAVPFACVTAGSMAGRWVVRHRLCAVPEEIDEVALTSRSAPTRRLLRLDDNDVAGGQTA
jgi:membrane glycosyltransferase